MSTLLAFLLGAAGCFALALGIERHWRGFFGIRPQGRSDRVRLRMAAAGLLAASLLACLVGRPVSLGILLWTVEIMAAAVCAAVILSLFEDRNNPAKICRGHLVRLG